MPAGSRLWTPFDYPFTIGYHSVRQFQSLSNGDRITVWNDLKGNNSLEATNQGTRPEVVTSSTFGGLKAMEMVAAGVRGDLVDSSPSSLLDIGTGDFFLACAFTVSAAGVLFECQGADSAEKIKLQITTKANKLRFECAGATVIGTTTMTYPSTHVYCAVRKNGVITTFLNGQMDGAPTSGSDEDVNNDGPISIGDETSGATITYGEFIYGGSPNQNVIDFDANAFGRDRALFEGYLAHRLNIAPITLGSFLMAHPYKFGPPKK